MEYAQGLSRLIQVKTVSGSGSENFAKLREVYKELFPNVYKTCIIEVVYKDAMLFKLKGKSDKKPIVLMAHQDVVPTEDSKWDYPPYDGVIDDGKVWGRGAMDCKNNVYAELQAFEELISEGVIPDNDVYIALSDCEENFGDSAIMVRDYLTKQGVKPFIVLDEGGAVIGKAYKGMVKRAAMVGVLEKGYADVKFIAKSKGGHSSSPGNNTPMVRLSRLILDIDKHNYFKNKMEPEILEMFKGAAGCLKNGPLKFVLKHIGFFKPLVTLILPKVTPMGKALFATTIVFTMSKGAEAPNVIPQEATATANLRFIPHQNSENCLALLKKLADKYDLEMEVLECRDAMPPVSTKSEGYNYLTTCVAEGFPDVAIAPYIILGGTDCRHYQEICDCSMRFSPMELSFKQLQSMHSKNENIDVDAIGEGVSFFKILIKNNK